MKVKEKQLTPAQQYKAQLLKHRLDTLQKKLKTEVVAEHRFHPERRWRFDFFLPAFSVAIECEGGAFSNGRHTRGKGFVGDMEKYNQAQAMGILVLRFTPDQLLSTEAIELIKKCLNNSNI